jgi:hypothetical protein
MRKRATGSVVCQFVYVIVVRYPVDLGCIVGDAWESLANIRGNRCYSGSCAPNVQEGHVGTSTRARCCRYGLCVVSSVHCCVREVTADVLMTGS